MDDDVMDALQRIFEVRDLRCGEGLWQPPSENWAQVVQGAWPDMYFLPPSRVPDGWCDILLALSEHLEELCPDAKVIDAFEDLVFGGLSLKVSHPRESDEIRRAVGAYEHVASTMCRVCGGHVKHPGTTGVGKLKRVRIVCDRHAE